MVGLLAVSTMSEIADALIEAEVALEEDLGETFAVDGIKGVFACVLDAQGFGDTHTTGGVRTDATLTLSFRLTAGYTPELGHTVNVGGKSWSVDGIQKTKVKWILSLISKDE